MNTLTMNNNNEWGLSVMLDQEAKYRPLMEMREDTWERWVYDYIATMRHTRRAVEFVNFIASLRDSYIPVSVRLSYTTTRPSEREPAQIDMNLLRDMVDEPWKYGDDIAEALELEQQLLQTRKAWRVHYMWVRKEHEERDAPATVIQTAYRHYKTKQNMLARLRTLTSTHRLHTISATKIQAAWRGFEERCNQRWTDCARCLCHRVSYWMIGGPDGVCEDCFHEVMPHYDPVEIIGEFPDEFPPEERFPDYESEPESDPEEDRGRRSRRTCESCERATAMVGCAHCANCYRDEKLYKHDEL